MFRSKIYLLLAVTIISILLVSACGQGVDAESAIQTSVAETVAAQTPVMIPVTQTPDGNLPPTKTPFAQGTSGTPISLFTATIPPVTPGSSKAECASASLQDESIVDGQIFRPGDQFTKTWYITNTSNCVWDTSYKIIFWDGDLLGGGYYYNLPQSVGPGQTIPISLILIAPATDGTYRSEWKLQTPDGHNFGVGMYQTAFYTEIAVSSATKPSYGITSVEIYAVREPQTGCPANTLFTIYAIVSTSGPYEFSYYWDQKDGNNSEAKSIYIKTATETTFKREWKFGRANTQGPKWVSFNITEPVSKEFRVDFEFVCP